MPAHAHKINERVSGRKGAVRQAISGAQVVLLGRPNHMLIRKRCCMHKV